MSCEVIKLLHCSRCQAFQVPPRLVCTKCGGEELTQVTREPSGTIYSFTTIHTAPARFSKQVPYHVALVELLGGARVTARVERVPGESLYIGMPVRLSRQDEHGLWFRPEQYEPNSGS